MRREVPLVIAFICGLTMIVSFFVPHWPFGNAKDYFLNSYLIIAAFSVLLGICNLVKVHIKRIEERRPRYGYSFVLLAGLFGMGIPGLFIGGIKEETVFDYLFKNVHIPMSATMFSLLAFFIASASYRAFRARTVDAALLLTAGFVVMLGRVPLGNSLSFFMPEGYQLADLAEWIMAVPNTAGQRAIMMGAALGIMATSLRIILGIERSYLGGD